VASASVHEIGLRGVVESPVFNPQRREQPMSQEITPDKILTLEFV
jgi:hypothetical protein